MHLAELCSAPQWARLSAGQDGGELCGSRRPGITGSPTTGVSGHTASCNHFFLLLKSARYVAVEMAEIKYYTLVWKHVIAVLGKAGFQAQWFTTHRAGSHLG